MNDSTKPKRRRILLKALTPPPQEVHWRKAHVWHGLGFFTIVIILWADKLFSFRAMLGILKVADGKWSEFQSALQLAETDWRDLLCSAGLGHDNWPTSLPGQVSPTRRIERCGEARFCLRSGDVPSDGSFAESNLASRMS
jgi:hypothetical protein